jgi:hypothetical protein
MSGDDVMSNLRRSRVVGAPDRKPRLRLDSAWRLK